MTTQQSVHSLSSFIKKTPVYPPLNPFLFLVVIPHKKIKKISVISPQGPHSHILMMGGGGGRKPTEGHILYPKKSQLQNLSTPKITTFLAYPRKSLSAFVRPKKSLFYFSQSKKILVSFINQNKSFLAEISEPENHLPPPPSHH